MKTYETSPKMHPVFNWMFGHPLANLLQKKEVDQRIVYTGAAFIGVAVGMLCYHFNKENLEMFRQVAGEAIANYLDKKEGGK